MKKTSKIYPHFEELKKKILSYQEEFEKLNKYTNKFVKNTKVLEKLIKDGTKETCLPKIRAETNKFINYILKNINNNSLQTKNDGRRSKSISEDSSTVKEEEIYNLSNFLNILNFEKNDVNKDELLSLLLFCPFDLEANCMLLDILYLII